MHTLTHHVQTVHEGVKPAFKCQRCDFSCYRKVQLNRHMFEHDGDPFRCDLCQFSTKYKATIINHMKTHAPKNLMCEFCEYATHSGLFYWLCFSNISLNISNILLTTRWRSEYNKWQIKTKKNRFWKIIYYNTKLLEYVYIAIKASKKNKIWSHIFIYKLAKNLLNVINVNMLVIHLQSNWKWPYGILYWP